MVENIRCDGNKLKLLNKHKKEAAEITASLTKDITPDLPEILFSDQRRSG